MIFALFNFSKSIETRKKEPFCVDLFYKFILMLNTFYQTILTIPILTTLFSFFQTDSNNSLLIYKDISFSTTWNYVNIILSSLCLTLFLIISLCNNLLLNDNRSKTILSWGTPFHSARSATFIFKIILTIFFVYNFGTEFQDRIKIGFSCACIIIIVILKMLIPVGYHKNIFWTETYFQGAIFGNCLIYIIYPDIFSTFKIETSIFTLAVFIVIFGFLYVLIILKIQSNLLNNKIDELKTGDDAYLQVMLFIELFKNDELKSIINYFKVILEIDIEEDANQTYEFEHSSEIIIYQRVLNRAINDNIIKPKSKNSVETKEESNSTEVKFIIIKFLD